MKIRLLFICLSVIFSSCENKKEKSDENINSEQKDYQNIQPKDETERSVPDQPIDQNSTDKQTPGANDTKTKESYTGDISGRYIKTNHTEDTNCSCYCVTVTMGGTSELCLSKNELYINVRYSGNQNQLNIYYTGKSKKTSNKDLPWDKFETNIPIAVLNPTTDGGLKLDWKGFTIDGEIAVDYALFGKKTLEGTYKKQ